MPEGRTPGQVFDEMLAAEKARAASETQSQSQEQKDVLARTLGTIADHMKKTTESNARLEQRFQALEAERETRRAPANQPDLYEGLTKELGIDRNVMQPVIAAEAEKAAQKYFEKTLGPAVRENEALQRYQETHPDFDLQKFNSYVNRNPEVKALVDLARQKGAVETGIELGETRRQIDERIAEEAKGQAKSERRTRLVEQTRPDAQILGAAGAGAGSRNVSNPLTAEKLAEIYAHADAGNWAPFEQTFHQSHLPSEEAFQRLAQS